MRVFSFISNIIKPIASLIDGLHTSDEEKLQLKNKLVEIENVIASKVLDYEGELIKVRSAIIVAEAQGHSWWQRNWRPITMLTFLVLIVCDSFGLLVFRLSSEAWTVLQVGLGGYVVGRSAEKVAIPLLKKKIEEWK